MRSHASAIKGRNRKRGEKNVRVEIFLLQPFRNFSKRHQVPLHSFFRGWRGWKRGEAGWKQGDSILRLFRFFQLFFFFPSQLFNDERASRCLSSAAHKSCAKLARRTHLPCFFRRDSALRGNPWIPRETWLQSGEFQHCGITLCFHGRAKVYDSFPRAGLNRDGLEFFSRRERNSSPVERKKDFDRYLSSRGKIYARVAFHFRFVGDGRTDEIERYRIIGDSIITRSRFLFNFFERSKHISQKERLYLAEKISSSF